MSTQSPVQYPIRAAAKLTGISIDTLRAWERRYQAVVPVRGERGRVYDAGQISRLRLLRDVIERGHAIGQVASLTDTALEALLAAPAAVQGTVQPTAAAAGTPELLEPVLNAIEAFDFTQANALLGRLAALLPARELLTHVVLPLMREVGDRWHAGTLSIAQEHMVSSSLRNLLGGLMRLNTPSAPQARILFATPSGEMHEFGILAAAMLAASSGFEAVYLGPNLPAREIIAASERTCPLAIVVAIKTSSSAEEVIEELRLVASQRPMNTELWIGGGEAGQVLPALRSSRLFALHNFEEFEGHLARLKGASL
ncbi:MerR family transcriptional regulator [Paludibaculum fermentans]|uniref:MerR family transcriptional regulator n=1 Tax=Paludibaculum fermentans TaxID=1473598 RepID=A0A7S7SL10_PALFE|nr:B12-binding domain-containing protein [Paludibaculum fermentans]QOY88899.1 MerR family transcriptional regulator [Paludibaculum fermentans]